MIGAAWRRVRIKRADRLVWGSVLASVLIAWLVLVGLDTFINFAKQVGDIGRNGYTLGQAVAYILLTVPRRVYDWFVFAALIGSLMGLGGLGASGELTALRAAGMSKLRICLSAAALVLVLMAGVFLLGETAAPAGEQRAQNIQLTMRSGHLGITQRSGLWAKDGDTIINAKAALARTVQGRPSVELADVRVFGFNAAGELTSFQWAKTATQKGGQWIMHAVRSTAISPQGAHSTFAKQRSWKSGLDPQVLELSVESSSSPWCTRNTSRSPTCSATSITCAATNRIRIPTSTRSGAARCIRSTRWCWCCARCRSRSARCAPAAWAGDCSSACCWRSAGSSCSAQ
jgi:lipopolysaccharide export system permease protein